MDYQTRRLLDKVKQDIDSFLVQYAFDQNDSNTKRSIVDNVAS